MLCTYVCKHIVCVFIDVLYAYVCTCACGLLYGCNLANVCLYELVCVYIVGLACNYVLVYIFVFMLFTKK